MKTLLCLTIFFFSANAIAQQMPQSNGAFEDDCFYPEVEVDIDTAYGGRDGQQLGHYLATLPPLPGENYGRIGTYGLPGHIGKFTTFSTGPGFNVHNRQNIQELGIDLVGSIGISYRFGHFRDTKHLDLYVAGQQFDTIYWVDDEGKFDRSQFTELRPFQPNEYSYHPHYLTPNYVANLSSDTIEDIVGMGVVRRIANPDYDSTFLVLFKGGKTLFQPDKAISQDSSFNMGHFIFHQQSRGGTYADFRGTGRLDAVFFDDSSNGYFYKNDPPFSLQKLAHSILYDTLLSRRDNPKLKIDIDYPWNSAAIFTMQAFRRKDPNDHSVDLIPHFPTKNSNNNSLWIYRGGPDFGKKRLSIDNPDFLIKNPANYDSKFGFINVFEALRDVGDMTGTGNRVLYAGGNSVSGFLGTNSFYVLGDAMNDKIDMYYESQYDCGLPDTLTADNDNRQDILIGNACAKTDRHIDRGWDMVGSLGLLHGSSKIPVHLNVVVQEVNITQQSISIFPNPVKEVTTLSFDWNRSEPIWLLVRDMLGRLMLERKLFAEVGKQSWQMNISELPSGTYAITLQGANGLCSGRMTVIH